MPVHFDLIITADHPNLTAEFRLLDANGELIASRQTDFKTIPASRQHGLFDLRNYLRQYVAEGQEVAAGQEIAAVAQIGVCIAEEVLGREVFEPLWQSEAQRRLRIQLPGAAEEENYLAAALARVPWEIARPGPDQETLGERNLLVRIVHDMRAPASQPLEFARDESLRVLFVLAEARGSRPLGSRQERLDLLRLFQKEIYPRRRVVAHFLTHGVTRERLKEQIRDNGGYHAVHWSGHGHLNLLELAKPGGAKDLLSGEELLDLFRRAGGFLPRLFFLSACHSGDILRVKDWADFLAIAQGKEPGTKEAGDSDIAEKDIDLQEQPGFTGSAHALLRGGVPSVVAMRYAVGDDYARELAVEFYRALLADAKPKSAAEALTMARQALFDRGQHNHTRFAVCDHATPVLYGEEQPGLALFEGRSPSLNPRNPRLHQITELTTAGHEHFVGRTWELAGLGSDFIGSNLDDEAKPVAVITGLGGMGKTAIVAEALSLWETRFDWVLLYQAKPNPLGFEALLRDIDMKLRGELKRYHEHVQDNPADAIYRNASEEFQGSERLERLTRNLVRALKDEAILLVLDNFETNLKPQAEPESLDDQPVWACQDPNWDRCLKTLAGELVGERSRVLITCRRPLAALADRDICPVLLGPLPAPEAALFLRAHPALSRMMFSGDSDEKALAMRLLNASRFHPLLMDRLAKLAAEPALRPQLLKALDTLEQTREYSELPELFARGLADGSGHDPQELAYLNDALATSLDQLIQDANPDARRLLWTIAIANEPVSLNLLRGVWSGEDHQAQQLRQIKQMLDILPQLPAEQQEKLKAMPPEFRAMLDAPPPEAPARPAIGPLLRQLVGVGLVTEEHSFAERKATDTEQTETDARDENPNISCHELVRERIDAWMEEYPHDRGGLLANAIRLTYAERLKAMFKSLLHQNMTAALHAGSRAIVYSVQAEAWDRLGGVASWVVTSTSDPRLLDRLIPHLQTAAESAPEGPPRWKCLCYLADALARGGQPDISLPFYEQAALQARAVAERKGDESRNAWSDVAWITGNWANALGDCGHPDDARQRCVESAEAAKNAGRPQSSVIASELEALRIDIMQGDVDTALPEVEARLKEVETWWKQHLAGQAVPEAPDAEFLARVFIGALDIANNAHRARENWKSALRLTDAVLQVKRDMERPPQDIARNRMNRAVELGQLGRFAEARAELEACLDAFQNKPDWSAKVRSSLASVLAKQGDVPQAITQARRGLALCEQLPDPADRAGSHNNLANYLERSGSPSDLAESPRHRHAALIYFLVARIGQHVQTLLRIYANNFRRAHAAGAELVVPRVAELLADSAFDPLEQWLRQRQVDPDELQAAIDQLLGQVRQDALQPEED